MTQLEVARELRRMMGKAVAEGSDWIEVDANALYRMLDPHVGIPSRTYLSWAITLSNLDSFYNPRTFSYRFQVKANGGKG